MRRDNERGAALLSTLLVMMLMSALMVGFVSLVATDQMTGGFNRDQTQAYAATHAGLEKLTADLGGVFMGGNYSPNAGVLNGLTAAPPSIPGFAFTDPSGGSGYRIAQLPTQVRQIENGLYQGLVGLVTPYELTVTARTATGGAEVRMRRELQTIAVPVFQFGIFSENDQSFFAGPNFNFGGRVHTNQNLFLAQGGNATLTLADRVTAAGEIVRTHLANGQYIGTSNHQGTVRMARAGGCLPPNAAVAPNCRNLLEGEGSVDVTPAGNSPGSVPPRIPVWNPNPAPGQWDLVLQAGNTESGTWENRSVGIDYNSYIRDGSTGARRLELPIVDPTAGTAPIDIILRPQPGDPTGPGTPFQERFFRLASLRVLLSDTAAAITNLPTVTAAAPVDLSTLVPGAGAFDAANRPMAASPGVGGGYLTPNNTRLVTGFLKIEKQTPGGAWQDVTMEILNLGVTGRNIANNRTWNDDGVTCAAAAGDNPSPDAVLRFQRVVDNPSDGGTPATNFGNCGHTAVNAWSTLNRDYMPLALYDAREGARREGDAPAGRYLAGIMHYVELDVTNLRRWLTGAIGANGLATMNETGYVVYFSDRRGDRDWGPDGIPSNADDRETGEFGFEDIVNRAVVGGASNAVLETGEDFNNNGALDVYGATPNAAITAIASAPLNAASNPNLRTPVDSFQARLNPPLFFRRALKVVNGPRGQLPANGVQGLTVAAENPVYVQGNYNACTNANAACAGGAEFEGVVPNAVANPAHVSAAVIADAVTFLSFQWNDINSFTSPHNTAGRIAATTWYRLGIIGGKGINFRRPNPAAAADHQDFGTDGGAHNFIRYIENWSNAGVRLNYRGSIISLYTSRQATGTYKCCNNVYNPPDRGYNFEQEFLNPNLLPPRTPMFRDVNTLTFRQILRPTQ